MKRWLVILALMGIAIAIYWFFFKGSGHHHSAPPPEPISLKKHSAAFNSGIDTLVNAYLQIADALVLGDTAAAKSYTRNFISRIDSIDIKELKMDTVAIQTVVESSLADIRSNAQSLMSQQDIKEMREDFRMVTELLYPAFFTTVNYEGPKLYLFYCDNAFGPGKGANWISRGLAVNNPYLGHDISPNTEVPCGEIKDTIKAH